MLLQLINKKKYIVPFCSLFMLAPINGFAGFSFIGNRYDGVYAGLDIGAGYTDARYTFTNANHFNTIGSEVLGYKFRIDQSGTVGGGHIGYNLQYNNIVVGLESSIYSTTIKKNQDSPFISNMNLFEIRVNQLGLINAHIGYATDPFMPYISGGFAMNQTKLGLNDFNNNVYAAVRERYNGFTVGAGFDYKFTPFLSLGISYNYLGVRAKNRIVGCAQCNPDTGWGSPLMNNTIDTNILLARLNYYMNLI